MSDGVAQRPAAAPASNEPPHRHLEMPRLFMMLGLVRRFAGPQARKELGLSDFEWRIMARVGDSAPMSLNDLAAASTHDKGQLSRGVKRLVSAGLLVRESRRGERGVFISPTPAGRAVYQQLCLLAVRQNEMVFEGVSAADRAVFKSVLEQMEANTNRLVKVHGQDYDPDTPGTASAATATRTA